MGGGLAQVGYKSMPVADTARVVNEENHGGGDDRVAAGRGQRRRDRRDQGVDALLIGTNDMCFEMGIPGSSTTRK
jgi:hypothetical protein